MGVRIPTCTHISRKTSLLSAALTFVLTTWSDCDSVRGGATEIYFSTRGQGPLGPRLRCGEWKDKLVTTSDPMSVELCV